MSGSFEAGLWIQEKIVPSLWAETSVLIMLRDSSTLKKDPFSLWSFTKCVTFIGISEPIGFEHIFLTKSMADL